MNILAVVYQILVLLMLAASGMFLRKKKILTVPVIKGINSTVMVLAWPFLILMSTQRDFDSITNAGFLHVLGLSTLCMGLLSLLLFTVCKKWLSHEKQAVFTGLCALPNAGFVGIPLVHAFYGDAGVTYLAAYIVAFNLVLWSMYLFFFEGKFTNPIKAMLNPGMIAGVTATLLLLFRIRIPEPFASFFNQLASLTTPLIMILLGARLIESLNIKQLGDPAVWVSVFIRLIAFPLAVFLIMQLMNIQGMERGILVLASAMPCASAMQMFSEKYDTDYRLAAQGGALSLVLCLVTIPLVLLITGI